MLGQKLIEARPEFPVGPFGLAQLLCPGQRNDVACLAPVGEHQPRRVTVAPDHARMTGDALALDFEIHPVRDKGGALI